MDEREWKIEWGAFLGVGVSAMDEEHRQFIARVNDVNKAIVEAEDKTTVERLMQLMLAEALQHFAHEERILQKHGYPGAARHAEKHAQLAASFQQALEEIRLADISYVWALKGLRIKQLLVEHLLQEDMQYKEYLRARRERGELPGSGRQQA